MKFEEISRKFMDLVSKMSFQTKAFESPLVLLLASLATVAAIIFAFVYIKYKQKLVEIDSKIHSMQSGDFPSDSLDEDATITGKWPTDNGESKVEDVHHTLHRDPVEYCSHIPGEVKKTKARIAARKIEETLSDEQREEERDVQRQQLEAIYKLMEDQKDKFGVDNVDDVQTQMGLYAM